MKKEKTFLIHFGKHHRLRIAEVVKIMNKLKRNSHYRSIWEDPEHIRGISSPKRDNPMLLENVFRVFHGSMIGEFSISDLNAKN